ncbi:saccharopine dehydrogenase family protein [Moraxella haemolytica]|uniref:saccharopine dehydrogenase family protein n=1 Tax=Moraxella haemolytica TaxID=2904119 RepID=UPI002543353A|nr:saccharopine dehydrogenase family protein [Moraxella sp. ZY171148]WII96044.1 saccharopine dehydrogenase family protein [Moraxella sp. ZY171148]
MNKPNILIIGAGGVAQVVAHKVAQYREYFGTLHIASRTVNKCQAISDSVQQKQHISLQIHTINALNVDELTDFIRSIEAGIVINVGSSFINQSVLKACITTGASYLDTAIHEEPNKVCETPPWYENYEWRHKAACERAGITAILGVGFDPGVVNAYARIGVDYFDEGQITDIDIIDINAGSHGRYFATNFDPEINFREFTGVVYTWQNCKWQTNQMFEVKRTDDLPVVGERSSYLCGHDEIHSLHKNLDVPNIRFWMGFGDHYINVFTVLKNLGLLSEQPVMTAEGVEIVPLKVVKALLPDPSSLAKDYTGHTCIGNKMRGKKDGVKQEIFIYNIADHAKCYQEVGSQAISYTAGVPAVAAAVLIAKGDWRVNKMVNVEELDPRPFINLLNDMGLPTHIQDESGHRLLSFDI